MGPSTTNCFVALALSSSLLLTACESKWGAPEDRINAAYPVSQLTLDAKHSLDLALASNPAARDALANEYQAKLKVRALECSHGYTPTPITSQQSIRDKLVDTACFTKSDRELLNWVNRHRLRLLLTAPPADQATADAARIVGAAAFINRLKIATDAPVAVVASKNHVEILNLRTAAVTYSDSASTDNLVFVDVSANGRIFVTGYGTELQIRDAASGEILLTVSGSRRLQWLDALSALVIKEDPRSVELLDFETGNLTTFRGGLSGFTLSVFPISEDRTTFLACDFRTLLKFKLSRNGPEPQIALTQQRNDSEARCADNVTALSGDRQTLVVATNDLYVTDVATLETERLSISPLRPQSVVALPGADEFLIQAISTEGGVKQKILSFSASSRDFSPAEDSVFDSSSSVRIVQIPALNATGIINASTITVVPAFKFGLRYSAQALSDLSREELKTAQEKLAAMSAGRTDGQINAFAHTASGPFVDLSKDAVVESVGVYESKYGTHGAGKPSRGGPVALMVRRSGTKRILVLSSYEPVDWHLSGDGVGEIKAILLSGSSDSSVAGTPSIQIVRLSRAYAYDRTSGNFAALQQEVAGLTGKSIEKFQGAYSGSTFIVGGI